MRQPIGAIIICAQQNFEIIGGLNPVKIEIEDDRIINSLKKHRNVINKLTLLGILLPESKKKQYKTSIYYV